MVVLPFVHPGDEVGVQSAAWVPVHLLYFGALAVTLLVLVGTLARQLQQAGRLGVAGLPVAFFGAGILLAVDGPIIAFLAAYRDLGGPCRRPRAVRLRPRVAWVCALARHGARAVAGGHPNDGGEDLRKLAMGNKCVEGVPGL